MHPPPTPHRRSPYLIPAVAGAGIIALFVAALFVVGLTATEDEPGPATAASSAHPSPPTRARPTAQEIADRLETLYPLPNPRDNTSSCAPSCRGLITTDTVSIYDWTDEATAKRWKTGKTAQRVGPYVLSYAGTEQAMTSAEARTKMAVEVRRMMAAH